jgi:hypothetical protein
VKVHVAVSSSGETSALSTGQSSPVSYWPGGSRSSRFAFPRPVNPRVNFTRAPPDVLVASVLVAYVLVAYVLVASVLVAR